MALFDTSLVVISRIRARRPIDKGWTDHTSHRLARISLEPPGVAALLGLWSASFVGLGLGVGQGVIPLEAAVVPAVAAVLVLVALLRIPVYPAQSLRRPEEDGTAEEVTEATAEEVTEATAEEVTEATAEKVRERAAA
jgi:UDP-GlcNAc:undecaprenyl-phosphate GlcNAc-1-phosphate transferase